MHRTEKRKFLLVAFAAALIAMVLVGDEVRGLVDGLSAGFSDEI